MLKVTVAGPQGSGKTTALKIFQNALFNLGIASEFSREDNKGESEAITIDHMGGHGIGEAARKLVESKGGTFRVNTCAPISEEMKNGARMSLARIAGNNLARICHHAAATSGWWNDSLGRDVRHRDAEFLKLWVATKLALVHSEVSEGLEGHRKGKMDDHLPHRPMLEVELADAVIRIMDLAGGLDMDIGGAIAEKLAYNAQRADHKPENRNAAGGKAY